MKRYIGITFINFLYILFGIGTMVSLFIVYKDIDSIVSIRFVMGYMFLTFFLLIYTAIVTVFKLKRLKWIEKKKRLKRFIFSFILFSGLNYGIGYYLRTSPDFYGIFFTSFGLSFGVSFIDIVFSRE